MTWAGLKSLISPRTHEDQEPPVADDFTSLLKDLRHRKVAVRARAAYSLGQLGLEDATEPLTRAASDSKPEVRRAALSALWLIDPDAFAETAVELSGKVPHEQLFADMEAAFAVAMNAQSLERKQ